MLVLRALDIDTSGGAGGGKAGAGAAADGAPALRDGACVSASGGGHYLSSPRVNCLCGVLMYAPHWWRARLEYAAPDTRHTRTHATQARPAPA
jgi:hypothetical protein